VLVLNVGVDYTYIANHLLCVLMVTWWVVGKGARPLSKPYPCSRPASFSGPSDLELSHFMIGPDAYGHCMYIW